MTKETPDKNNAKKLVIEKLKQSKGMTDTELVVDVCLIQTENNQYILLLSIPSTEDGALTLKEIEDGITTLLIVKALRSQAATFKHGAFTHFYNENLSGKTEYE